jgi:hypothetical protein
MCIRNLVSDFLFDPGNTNILVSAAVYSCHIYYTVHMLVFDY